ncbi:hypothetical protein HK100_001535 [Physocladia obscura]|uniref:Uncharacterized protein n=1 Tax=Physocladia obscura TaxID=109957 RepID=A0AAD5SWX5_9FUNG|nr:hypothetical protein HK100_001535 [Physocladia obscura]
MAVFEHCLSKHAEYSKLESFHEIDEIADAILTQPPPLYNVVKDPTITENAVLENVSQRIERDRNVFCEAQLLHKLKTKGPTIGSSHFFSGAIYKRTIESKDREIRQLREKLYDKTVSSKIDEVNVKNLKAALNKSMKYYCYAEEWQHHESERLQQDVRYLKAEMSSLMAFLINSEEEKRTMLIEMESIRNVSSAKDEERKNIETQRNEYKQKLADAYTEYLSTNELITRLRKEAEHGSDAIISRNEVLQRNIDKISKDFEITAKDLAAATLKIRDLQFELDEMVLQFNITGQAQKTAEDLNVRLGSELDQLKTTYNELRHLQSETAMRVVGLEKHIRDLEQLLEVTRTELENQASDLRTDLMAVTELKRELEELLKSSRQEVEKLSMALKSLTRTKDQTETAFRIAVQKHEKDIASREEEIKELKKLRVEDADAFKKLQEQKEQLMFQVTDLQNNLDRELSNVNVLSFEVNTLKRTSEEKIFNLEEQVEKLTNAKINLANDKRTLAEKLRVTRIDLQDKEQQLDKISTEFEGFKAGAAETVVGLRGELKDIHAKHETLSDNHKSLNQKQVILIDSNLELTVVQESLKKQVKILEGKTEDAHSQIKVLQDKNQAIYNELEISQNDKNEMKIHLDSVLQKLLETTSILNQERGESSNTIKEKTEQIIKMSKDLYRTTEDRTRLDTLCVILQEQVRCLEENLQDTQVKLAAEVFNKEQFEVHLYDLRRKLMAERSLRSDFEHMHGKIDRMLASKQLERLAAMKMRDRKLMEVSKQLALEHVRLQGISAMLPSDENLQTIESPEIPDFNPDGKPAKNKREPDMRVTVTKK